MLAVANLDGLKSGDPQKRRVEFVCPEFSVKNSLLLGVHMGTPLLVDAEVPSFMAPGLAGGLVGRVWAYSQQSIVGTDSHVLEPNRRSVNVTFVAAKDSSIN